MATTFSDNFESQTVGALPAGWTTHLGGPGWQVTSTSPITGFKSMRTVGGATDSASYSAGATRSDLAVQITTTVFKITSFFACTSPFVRCDNLTNAGYRVICNWNANTATWYQLNTALGSPFAIPSYAAGTKVNIKIEAEGTTLRMRIWEYGTTEPGTWTSTITDSTTTSGKGGISGFTNGTGASEFDEYYEGDVGTIFGVPTQAIAPNNAAIYYSPLNWVVDGSNARSNNPGAYVQIPFTGSQLFALVNQTTATVKLRYKVDNFPWVDQTLNAGTGQVNIGSGLAAGSHLATVYFEAANSSAERWGSSGVPPQECVNITSWGIDLTGALGAYVPLSKKALLFADSIGEGYGAAAPGNDAQSTWVPATFAALGAEIGSISFGGQGFKNAGAGSVPTLAASWDSIFYGQSRLNSGLFTVQPDYLVCTQGVNGSFVAADVAAQITAWRAAAPTARIFMVIPFGRQSLSVVTAGFNAYQAATPDTKCHLIDCGTAVSIGLTSTGYPTFSAADGLHPRSTYASVISSALTKQISLILNPSGGGGINGSAILGML